MSVSAHGLKFRRSVCGFALLLGLACMPLPARGEDQRDGFAKRFSAVLEMLSGRREQFQFKALVKVVIDQQWQDVHVELLRSGAEFELAVEHADYAAIVQRREEQTRLILPKHRVMFVGTRPATESDPLRLDGLSSRLLSPRSEVGLYGPMLLRVEADGLLASAQALFGLSIDVAGHAATIGEMRIEMKPHGCSVRGGNLEIEAEWSSAEPELSSLDRWANFEQTALDRDELETTLVRGVRRALEIVLPGEQLRSPRQKSRLTEHGQLLWVGDQRVVLLHGTAEQVGRAHGELLKEEANTCIDSVLYTFGTANTIMTGKWFRNELAAAFAQLEEHIPQRFRDENRALALALERPIDIVDTLNVFPEMFHCSGFALFGEATVDGKLYHGRVLDYMTTIGLQDAATNFIVAIDGKIPFANIGYAGFTGSVSGMNAAQISLGEMGGRGEGEWDGVPMATLMRMALEDCSTLEQVKQLWRDSPRTCEYYYVFADGKTNEAVGVAAVPERIEFVLPGQTDSRLGDGIKDAVVLSAGERLLTLRERVLEVYGQVDAKSAMWLMSRPVAMDSNLHNVLFVPSDGVLYVANADHQLPAADRPYVKLDLRELLEKIENSQAPKDLGLLP